MVCCIFILISITVVGLIVLVGCVAAAGLAGLSAVGSLISVSGDTSTYRSSMIVGGRSRGVSRGVSRGASRMVDIDVFDQTLPTYGLTHADHRKLAMPAWTVRDGKISTIDDTHLPGGIFQRVAIPYVYNMVTKATGGHIVHAAVCVESYHVAAAYAAFLLNRPFTLYTTSSSTAASVGANTQHYSSLISIYGGTIKYVTNPHNEVGLLLKHHPTKYVKFMGTDTGEIIQSVVNMALRLPVKLHGYTVWTDSQYMRKLLVDSSESTGRFKFKYAPNLSVVDGRDDSGGVALLPTHIKISHDEAKRHVTEVRGQMMDLADNIRAIKARAPDNIYEISTWSSDRQNAPTRYLNTLINDIDGLCVSGDTVARTYPGDYNRCDGMSNIWTLPERSRCRFGNIPNYSDAWKDLDVRSRAIDLGVWVGCDRAADIAPDVDISLNMMGYRACNTFNPMILAYVVKKYVLQRGGQEPRNISMLDPSMGWGDRLIAATALGFAKYVGFDPNTSLHAKYNQIADDLSAGAQRMLTKFYAEPFAAKPELVGRFDFVGTSPPFYTLETYEGSEYYNKMSYKEWWHRMYAPYLRDMVKCAKVGGVLMLYVDRYGRYDLGVDSDKLLVAHGAKRLGTPSYKSIYVDINERQHINMRQIWVYERVR